MSPSSRILRTKLRKLLDNADDNSFGFAAESIGISENTLRAVHRDAWDQISRDSIERICDRFNIEVHELFELVPDNFWTPFERANEYTLITPPETEQGFEVRDENASGAVATFLQSLFPSIIAHHNNRLTSQPTNFRARYYSLRQNQ